MKNPIVLKAAFTLISGLLLTACGSSGSSTLVVPQHKAVAATSTTPVQAANSAELAAAKQAAQNAEAALAKANAELKTAQQVNSQNQSELAAAKKAVDDAKAALNKAQADLTSAKQAADKAIAEAKELGVKEYLDNQKAQAEKEAAEKEAEKAKLAQAAIKEAITGSFKGDEEKGNLPTKQNTQTFDSVHTNLVGVNPADGTATVSVNPVDNPEIQSITINGLKIDLLAHQMQTNANKKSALSELLDSDFASGKAPNGAKGWVGGWDGEYSRKMRFGVYVDENQVGHLFVNGKPSSSFILNGFINSGEAIDYKGSAIIGKDGQYTPLPNAIAGTVNFGTKKVDLSLQADADTKYNFGGTLKGNTFAGEQNGVFTQGGLYGAVDVLGGVLQINEGKYQGYHGVYGAGQEGRPYKP